MNAEDTVIAAPQDLVTVLKTPHTNKLRLKKHHRQALEKMATIFEQASSPLRVENTTNSPTRVNIIPPPRVND